MFRCIHIPERRIPGKLRMGATPRLFCDLESKFHIDANPDGPRRLSAPATQLEHSLATSGIRHGRDSSIEECETEGDCPWVVS